MDSLNLHKKPFTLLESYLKNHIVDPLEQEFGLILISGGTLKQELTQSGAHIIHFEFSQSFSPILLQNKLLDLSDSQQGLIRSSYIEELGHLYILVPFSA